MVLELLLPDQTRLTLAQDVTIGRGPESTVRLTDPSVSRLHARIRVADGEHPVLEDAGSSHGTWLDGNRLQGAAELHPGARLRMGNQELVVDRQRRAEESGRTLLVTPRQNVGPRLARGYVLKRLEAGEGDRRWVLQDRMSGRSVRMAEADATLVVLLDGSRAAPQLMDEAERRLGPDGPERLGILLAALGDRGFLDEQGPAPARASGWRRVFQPRRAVWPGAPRLVDQLHRHVGWLLTRPALALLALLAVAGLVTFVGLIVGRYGTPFVVAHKVGIGGVVFIAGRLAVGTVHELAHGVVLASYGRRVREAGLKIVGVFPYLYVDTSEAWLEPRRHRIAVSAAGPVSDLSLAAVFSLGCLAAPAGTVRDVLFQLAFGAYVGAFFNLNPLVERDGYHVLVDVLREPGLRRRAREQLQRRLSGDASRPPDSPQLMRYAEFGLAWSLLGAAAAGLMSLRYEHAFSRLAPPGVVWPVMLAAWVALLIPAIALVARPLLKRLRARTR